MSFLGNVGCLHYSSGIGARKIDAVQLSLQDAVCNVSSVNAYIKNTVAEVRQYYKMKETAATDGPVFCVPAKHRSHWYFSNEVRNSYEITLRM